MPLSQVLGKQKLVQALLLWVLLLETRLQGKKERVQVYSGIPLCSGRERKDVRGQGVEGGKGLWWGLQGRPLTSANSFTSALLLSFISTDLEAEASDSSLSSSAILADALLGTPLLQALPDLPRHPAESEFTRQSGALYVHANLQTLMTK